MTQQRRIGAGQTGQARATSGADPRLRRNADNQAGDRDIGPGLRIDANGKLTPRVSGPIVMRGDSLDFELERLADQSLDGSPVSVNSDGKLAWTPGDSVNPLELTIAVDVLTLTAIYDKLNELISALTRSKQLEP